MKRLKLLFSVAVIFTMGFSTAAFAGIPKPENTPAKPEAKAAAQSEAVVAKSKGAIVEWFHFNGDASDEGQLADPSNYSVESSPTCPTAVPEYRCDIQILSNDDQTQPDLSQTIMATKTRSTTTP